MKIEQRRLSRAEVDAWLEDLGSTDHDRCAVIRDLLRHARKDQMSGADIVICRQELERLSEGLKQADRYRWVN